MGATFDDSLSQHVVGVAAHPGYARFNRQLTPGLSFHRTFHEVLFYGVQPGRRPCRTIERRARGHSGLLNHGDGDVFMATDFKTFFEIYIRPSAGARVNRYSYEFRYAAATLLIACSKSDLDQDPAEKVEIEKILSEAFDLTPAAIRPLMEMADLATQYDYLEEIAELINEYFGPKDKRYLLHNLWRVAYADGRIDKLEEQFIDRAAGLIGLGDDEVATARAFVSGQAMAGG